MTWDGVQCGVQDWLKCAGINSYWLNQHCKVKCEPYAELHFSDVTEVGQDSVTFLDEGNQLVPVICSRLEFLLTVRIETGKVHDPCRNAVSLMNKARMYLTAQQVRDTFSAKNMAFVRATKIRRMDYQRFDEIVSRASLDLVFRASFSIRDCPVTEWIEKVTVSSDVQKEGTSVDAGLQVSQEQIP